MNSNEAYGVRIEPVEGTHPESSGLGHGLVVSLPPPPPKLRPTLPAVRTNGQQPARVASVQMGTSAPAGSTVAPGEAAEAEMGNGAESDTGPRVLSPPVNV